MQTVAINGGTRQAPIATLPLRSRITRHGKDQPTAGTAGGEGSQTGPSLLSEANRWK